MGQIEQAPIKQPLKDIKRGCENCGLSELCLPVGLDQKEVQHLERIVIRKPSIKSGAFLYRSGEPFHALFAVRTGSFKIYGVSKNGDEQVLGFHLPGEILGLEALSEGHYRCNAQALESASVCEIPFQQLEQLSSYLPGVNRQLHRIFSRELASEEIMVLTLGKKHAEERLASFLLSLAIRFKLRGYSGTEFRLAMSRSDIGNYLGLAVETVSSLFSRFQDQGFITVQRREIEINDMAKLKVIAGPCNQSTADEDE